MLLFFDLTPLIRTVVGVLQSSAVTLNDAPSVTLPSPVSVEVSVKLEAAMLEAER